MKYEVSERIRTRESQREVLNALEVQFDKVSKKVSKSVQMSGQTIVVEGIKSSFISYVRTDTTTISLIEKDDGWFVAADVEYRPSVWFWISLIIFTGVPTLIFDDAVTS